MATNRTAVRERPILFSAPMVRALLEGRKTQTRRLINPQPDGCDIRCDAEDGWYVDGGLWSRQCPYGSPGDRLWVRETFCVGYPTGDGHYSAIPWTGADEKRDGKAFYAADCEEKPDEPRMPWRPSIYMPRWASRITLEVTRVRVERLQDITTADAQAEGAQRFADLPGPDPYGSAPRWSMESPTSTRQCLGSARMAFANYWDKINKQSPWESNPWVWVIDFRRVQP